MKCEKFLWVIFIQFALLKECLPSNTTTEIITSESETPITNSKITSSRPSISTDVTNLELLEIFHVTNVTTQKEITTPNLTSVVRNISTTENVTWNGNFTVTSEAIASQNLSVFGLESTGVIAAGVFLVSAVVGYFSCVGFRRFMQKKYGDSQIVAGEDVYDTSDLRYFEI